MENVPPVQGDGKKEHGKRAVMRVLFRLALVAAIILAPGFLMEPGYSHSAKYNYIWTSQFADALRAGTLYPRWMPASFEGLGSPTFFFYPPVAFWLSGGLNALGLSTFHAIYGAAFLFLLFSGFAMHRWLVARSDWPLLGAIAYMVAPYHLLDLGVRGALAEFASFVWLPLIALGINALPRRRGILLLACAFAGLILTHLPMATLVGLFLIAPLVFARAWQQPALLIPATGAGVLAIGLTAFYLVPAISLQPYMSTQGLWSPYYMPVNWHFFWNPDPTLGNLQLLGLGLVALALAAPTRTIWTWLTVGTAIAAIGMLPFLWLLPPIDKVQFPWRLLGVTEFAAVTALFSTKGERLRRIFVAMGAALLVVPYALLVKYSVIGLNSPPNFARIHATMPDAVEYVPNGFNYRAIMNGQRELDLRQYKALPRGDSIKVERPGTVVMGRWTFPIWQVQLDGKPVPSAGPMLHFEARTPGTYRIVRVWLWQEIVGGILSALAVLAAVALNWRGRRVR